MTMIRCAADEHYYDPAEYDQCPYCRKIQYAKIRTTVESHTETTIKQTQNAQAQSSKTRIIFGGRYESQSDDPGPVPVVGWLVIVDGPGKGRDLRLVPGMNRIGRDADMNIGLDFGDATISRREHAFLVYDPIHPAYFIQHGSGHNLTYLNGAVVIGPQALADRDRIRIGQTELLFVALCNTAFNWSE